MQKTVCAQIRPVKKKLPAEKRCHRKKVDEDVINFHQKNAPLAEKEFFQLVNLMEEMFCA